MKVQELRIGNYVEGVGTEESIRRINDSIQYNYNTEKYELDAIDIQFFKPIPLTEEWLEKFAFEWSIWHQAWHRLGFVFNLSERGVSGYYMHMVKRNNDIICPEIIYVHQLQNLYFVLTGEELTIK